MLLRKKKINKFPAEKLSLEVHSYKLVTLLVFTSAHRMQTLSQICLENIKESNNIFEIRMPDRIKTSGNKWLQPLWVLPIFPSLQTLSHYLQRTSSIRTTENKFLYLGRKPHHAASSQTMSRHVKNLLQKSGIDISSFFFTHSTGHEMQQSGLKRLMYLFVRFYDRPVMSNPDDFARSIIYQYK